MSLPLSFFPPRLATDPAPTYSLLTLTPALLALLEAGDQTLEIRGHSTDAAVLVSEDKTWDIRGVQNSNSLCLCACTGVAEGAAREEGGRDWFKRAPAVGDLDEDDADDEGYKGKRIQIETILHETLEVVPSVARTERLPSLLKGSEYVGDSEDDSSSPVRFALFFSFPHAEPPASTYRLTFPPRRSPPCSPPPTPKLLQPSARTELSPLKDSYAPYRQAT